MKYSKQKENYSRSACFSNTTDLGSDVKSQKQPSLKRNRIRRFFAVLLLIAEIISAIIISGCSGDGQQSSSSSAESELTSGAAAAPVSAVSTLASKSSTVSSSAGSSNDYALPATSKSASPASNAPTQSATTANPAADTASQTAEETNSQPVFQSLFGDASETDSDNAQMDQSPNISLAEYDKLQDGMTYSQVKAIIGGEGKSDWHSGEKGSSMYMEAYRWSGAGNSDSYAEVTFEDGKLDMKIQFGLN